MFITADCSPSEILSELLLGSDSPTRSAEFQLLRHNDDLCPKFRDNVDHILTAFSRHRTLVYDIQGIRDSGADVLLQYEDERDGMHSIALQIKDYREIEDDIKRPIGRESLTNKLKAQRTDAQSKHRAEMFYILLCGADGKRHREVVRKVCAEFTSLADVRVILPKQAWAFYSLAEWEIASWCTRLLCKDDYVLSATRERFRGSSDAYRWMALAAVVDQIDNGMSISSTDLLDYAVDSADPDSDVTPDSFQAELQRLFSDEEFISEDGSNFALKHDSLMEARALYLDVRIRHGLSGQDAVKYLGRLTES